jgi:type I restriction enzyme, R subunit
MAAGGGVDESVVEQAALGWLAEVGWTILPGAAVAPDTGERASYRDTILVGRLRAALTRLNPGLPADAIDEGVRQLTTIDAPTLAARNRAAHRMLSHGIPVEYRDRAGDVRGGHLLVLDHDDPGANDLLAVSQFTVQEDAQARRADIVLFVNGLAVGVVELKNAADADTGIWSAFQQVQTYKTQVPGLFAANEVVVISDGTQARVGTLTAGREWFKPWRTVDGDLEADAALPELEVLIRGLLAPGRLPTLIRDLVVWETLPDGTPVKKMAGYHQFHAVRVAVDQTLRATGTAVDIGAPRDGDPRTAAGGAPGDRRIGVVWHTQGSGKSLTMAFFAGRIIREPAMGNPTIVVLTDRNDLDDQLFATFAGCQDLLRQPPVQAASRAHLRELLDVPSGGVVFTTIQKFMPDEAGDAHRTLSERRNVVVLADEAHRSQYDFVDGFARHMRDALPGASFIGFTGTPIEAADASTRAVFGDHISVYDIQQAVSDGATVPIYYESRVVRLDVDEDARLALDSALDEVTEGQEVERKEKLKSRWTRLEALVGADDRIRAVAEDVVAHHERRLEVLHGKAMVVCMSRRICVALHDEILRLRPEWGGADDEDGVLKVVMTGAASDPEAWQPHIRSKSRRERLAQRFRDPGDPFRIVIVRDMWLTGFDAPSLHTMYVDKPMRGHGLMQAIARVNRVFRNKPGGLVVDYIGLAYELKQAMATYTSSGGTGRTALDQDEAVALLVEKHEIATALFHGFDRSAWVDGTPAERLSLIPAAQEHVLAQPDGKDRLVDVVGDLTKAFALAVPHPSALALRDDVAFLQAIRAALLKRAPGDDRDDTDLEHAVRQLVSEAVSAAGVLDVFSAAGLPRPDISILSDDFLLEVEDMPQRHLAVELLQKLLLGEVRRRRARNAVQARSFAEMLDDSLRRYSNRGIETAQVIEELIALAKALREADRRGEELGLTEDELAFYDALAANASAVTVLGDVALRRIATELVETVRRNVTIDWALRENVRAGLRVLVKRALRRHGYPPEHEEEATRTVLEQAELLSQQWLAA